METQFSLKTFFEKMFSLLQSSKFVWRLDSEKNFFHSFYMPSAVVDWEYVSVD